VTELGRFIAEEFSVALAGAGEGFKVIDRVHLKSIIKEHKLSATGLIDPKTARQLGKIAGVEALVTGTITPFGESVRVTVKVLDTATAEVIDANRGNVPKTEAIEQLLKKGIDGPSGFKSGISTSLRKKGGRGASLQKVEVNNFTIRLNECLLSGRSLTCELMITNNGEDCNFILCGNKCYYSGIGKIPNSRCFDDLGNEYIAEKVGLGSNKGRSAGTKLVFDIPTIANMSFSNIPEEAKYISLLEINCREYINEKNFRVQFRNVPLLK
jgi:hypothetical protein